MPQLMSLVVMVVLVPPLIEVTPVHIPLLMSLMATVAFVHSLMGLTSAIIPVFLLQGLMAMVPLLASLIPVVNLRPLVTVLMSLRLVITIILISPLLGLVSMAALGPLLHPMVPLMTSIQKLNLETKMVVMSVVMVKKLYLMQSTT